MNNWIEIAYDNYQFLFTIINATPPDMMITILRPSTTLVNTEWEEIRTSFIQIINSLKYGDGSNSVKWEEINLDKLEHHISCYLHRRH